MKFPIIISAIILVAILTGTLQLRELNRLRARTGTLLEAVRTAPEQDTLNPPTAISALGFGSEVQPTDAAVEDDALLSENDKIARKATEFIREAEEVVSRGSPAEAAVKLTPKLLFASPAMLKEVLAQLNASSLAEPPKQMAWKHILNHLAKKEPAEAMRIALEDSRRPALLFPDVFQHWIDRDPAAAEAWYLQKLANGDFPAEPPELVSRAELSIFGTLADSDLDRAVEVITTDEPTSRDAKLMRLRDSLTDLHSWSQVANLTVRSEDAIVKQSLLVALSDRAFAFGTTEEQLDRIDQLGFVGEELEPFVITAMRTAHRNENPAQLAEWGLERLPEHLIEQRVTSLVAKWRQTDRTGVEDWVGSLPAGEAKDVGSRILEILADGDQR